MSNISAKKIFHINSRNRLSGTDSDFIYKLDMPSRNNFNSVCVVEISIPKSYYLIQQNENTFYVDETLITIPAGNYTRRSFQTVLNSLLPAGFTCTYPDENTSAGTGKFTFTGTPDSQFIFTNYLWEVMGFDANTSYILTGGTLVSVNVINFQKESTLFLKSDIAMNDTNSILADVFANGNSDFSTIVWRINDLESHSKELRSRDNNTYRFQLMNEDGVIMNLNGLNILITLLVYEKNPVYRMINGFIKHQLLKD